MKILPMQQGGLDSLCGVYSICNAYRIVNGASDDDVEILFGKIIKYLSKKKILDDILLGGMNHKNMSDVLGKVVKNVFVETLTLYKWKDYTLSDFWNYSQSYLEEDKTAMILSVGGRENHYSTVSRMTPKTMFLLDSGGMKRIHKNQSKLQGYPKEDMYVIYPNQCYFMKG